MKTITGLLTADQLDDLKQYLRRQTQTRIINSFVEAGTIVEVKKIVSENKDYMALWPFLYNFAERAMIRIRHLEIQKRITWSEYLN